MRKSDVLVRAGRSRWALLLMVLFFTSCSTEERQEVSFSRDIQPMINAKCLKCHYAGRTPCDLAKDDSYQDLMRYVSAGKAESSRLYVKLRNGHLILEPLSRQQMGALKSWIDQGAREN